MESILWVYLGYFGVLFFSIIVTLLIILLSNLSKQKARMDAAEKEIGFIKGRLAAAEKLLTKLRSGEERAVSEPETKTAEKTSAEPAVPPAAAAQATGQPAIAAPLPEKQVAVEPPVQVSPAALEKPASAPLLSKPLPAKEKDGGGLEEILSAKLFVWLGAVALLLATIFLIKYSFDKGWVTPPLRIAMGLFFGILFLGLGEFLAKRSNYVSQGFSAAGIGVLYASFLAAVNLYHLISPVIGFILMAATTFVAIALSLRRGPIVAIIGLLGGFMTPYWLKTGTPRPQALFSYLLLLEMGVFYTAKKKKWLPYALMAMAGGFLWVVAWYSTVFTPSDSMWIGVFLLGSTALFLFFTMPEKAGSEEKGTRTASVSQFFFGAIASVLMAVLCARAGYSVQEWIFFGLLSAGTIALAHFKEEHLLLPFISFAVSFILFCQWPLDGLACSGYLGTISSFAALFSLSGYALANFSRRKEHWALLSAISSVIYLLTAYFKVKERSSSVPWGTAGFALALIFSFLAWFLIKKGEEFRKEAGWIAAAASVHLCLAVSFSFDEAWWSAGWGLIVPLILYIAYKYELKALRIISFVLVAATVARLVFNPYILKYPVGDTPLLNWMLYGYGLPLLAFGAAVYLARLAEDGQASSVMESASVMIALAFGSLEIHHFVNGKLSVSVSTLKEWGMIFCFALLLTHLAFYLGEKFALKAFSMISQALSVILPVVCGMALFLSHNPLFSSQDVGSTFIANKLQYIYLLPSLLLLWMGWRLKASGKQKELVFVSSLSSFLLFFAFVVFEVRQAFHGAFLNGGGITNPEKYTYSIVFVLLGLAFAVAGMVTGRQFPRIVSLVLMLVATFKVFLYDVSALKGILRPLSFFGLGFSLLLLAYLYRRFVFGLDRKKNEPVAEANDA